MESKGRLFSFKWLALLTGAVLLVHLTLLRAPLLALNPSQVQTLQVFSTRSIALQPEPVAVQPEAAAPAVTAAASDNSAVPPGSDQSNPQPLAALAAGEVSPTLDQPAAQEREAASPLQDATPQDPATPSAGPPAQPSTRDYAALTSVDKLPGSVQIKYQVESNKFPYRANGDMLWQHDGSLYNAQLSMSLLGFTRMQTSRGQIGAGGLEPIRFSDKIRSEVAAHFVREKGKVTFSANTPDLPLLPGAQDRLSVLIQLASLIGSAPSHYPAGTVIAIQTIGPKAGETWLFTVGASESVDLPGGAQTGLKLVRSPREPFDQTVELWLAPALQYLPARVRITESNGDYIDQKWLGSTKLPDRVTL